MKSARIITALAAILAIPAMAADAPGYFKVPGTDTTIKVYGNLQLREGYGLNGDPLNDYAGTPFTKDTPAKTLATTHSDDWQQSGQWDGSWRYDMGVTTTTPSALGDINTVVLGRFKHGPGTPNGESVGFILEQGYVQIGGFEAGTDWSLFGYGAWEPNTLFGCASDEEGNWDNPRQIRYVGSPMPGLTLGASLESLNSTNNDGSSNGTTPNIAAVAAYAQDWGGVTFALMYQQRKDWSKVGTVTTTASGSATGFFLSGGWNITKNDQLTAMILKDGGSYGSGNDGFYADGSSFSFYKSTAMNLSYTHTWNDQFSSALTLSQVKWPKDVKAQTALGFLTPDDYKVTSIIANTTWQMTKTVSLGVEYQHTQNKASDTKPWIDGNGTAQDSNKLDMIRMKLNAKFF
jgi:hypothetical protein